jgi:uncharacterized Zn finger protein
MSVKSRLKVDLEHLCRIAGEKIFERGESYYVSGLVEILDIGATRVVAQVSGTEDYRTVVKRHGRDVSWECSCPALGEWLVCKHVVAVALAANNAKEDAPEVAASSRIRTYLARQETTKLARMIMSLAERDADLFRKLHRAAMSEQRRASDGNKRVRRVRTD